MIAKVYGIPNCSSVKKALDSLKSQNIEIAFHDFKKHGVNPQLLDEWSQQIPWQTLINRKGTTWRKLDDQLKTKADTDDGARALVLEHPTLIKRPVVSLGDELFVGKIDFSQND